MPTPERSVRWRIAVVICAAVAVTAGCGAAERPAVGTRPEATPSATASPTLSPRPKATPAAVTARPSPRPTAAVARSDRPAFRYAIKRVTAADLPNSWREGCPVGPSSLREMSLTYHGFDGRAHTGTLVVHASVTSQIAAVFERLYDGRFPVRRMVKVDAYGGDDDASMAADNTSAFNCRAAVGSSDGHWSMHAYGKAIDVNPVENPYVYDGKVEPPNGAKYADRDRDDPGMAKRGGVLVTSFAAYGWEWGGNWSSSKDYQHFSTNGQ